MLKQYSGTKNFLKGRNHLKWFARLIIALLIIMLILTIKLIIL